MKIFEDMFSSSRGAGVIGTLLALLVLVGFGTLYLFVFDQGMQGGEKSIASVIRDQESQITSLKSAIVYTSDSIKVSEKNQEKNKQLDALIRQHEGRQTKVITDSETIKSMQVSLTDTAKQWEEYKILYRKAERARAVGEKHPEMVTKSGKIFKNLTIKQVEDLRITVMHDGGSGSIQWNDLPDDWIDRFQYTAELAKKQLAQENQHADMSNKEFQGSAFREQIAFKTERIAVIDAASQKAASEQSQYKSNVKVYESSITTLQSQIAGERNKKGVRQTPRYQNEIRKIEQKIAEESEKMAKFPSQQATRDAEKETLTNEITKLRDQIQALSK